MRTKSGIIYHMSEFIPEKEKLPDQPTVGEVRGLIDDAAVIVVREVLRGNTKTYFDDPSDLIKRAGLKAHGEITPAVEVELDTDEGKLVIDKSHEQVRNPYVALTIKESHIAGGRNYTSETTLRIQLKTLYDLKDEQSLPPDAAAVWVEWLGTDFKDLDSQDETNIGFWLTADADIQELDREAFEKFKNVISHLK